MIKPLGGTVIEGCTVAERDLEVDEILDGYGMQMTYGQAENVEKMSAARYLSEGSSQAAD